VTRNFFSLIEHRQFLGKIVIYIHLTIILLLMNHLWRCTFLLAWFLLYLIPTIMLHVKLWRRIQNIKKNNLYSAWISRSIASQDARVSACVTRELAWYQNVFFYEILLDPLSRECISYLGVTRFSENKTENKMEFFLDGKIELDTTRSILQLRLQYVSVLLPEGKEKRAHCPIQRTQ